MWERKRIFSGDFEVQRARRASDTSAVFASFCSLSSWESLAWTKPFRTEWSWRLHSLRIRSMPFPSSRTSSSTFSRDTSHTGNTDYANLFLYNYTEMLVFIHPHPPLSILLNMPAHIYYCFWQYLSFQLSLLLPSSLSHIFFCINTANIDAPFMFDNVFSHECYKSYFIDVLCYTQHLLDFWESDP